ncbi:winged helix-turn-helix domain-containing protein [Agromyces sp. CCNWLW203]|uniref:winged helix-turn-helix domain-containing protein n=1 Tax=Agromyces sp. CCNWLW203 TaxID=3112842 RepID=UPI002F9651C3
MIHASPATDPIVRVRAFGTFSASVDGDDIPLGGPRARALLAALVAARGRLRPAETLLREVWGESSPGVRSALRANISRLRSTPLGPHLRGGRQGYLLHAGPTLEVDLWSVHRIAESSAAPGDDALDDLVTVIGAVAFEGAGTSPFLHDARAEARTALRRAVVRAVDAHPGHPLAPVVVERALAHDPDDPELRALLLAGRAQVRQRGIATGASAHDLSPAAATRRIGVPAPLAAYQSRPEDEARLAAALRLSRLVTLAGPAGVGKTRLVVEWARGTAAATQEHVWFCAGGGWLRDLSLAVGARDETLDSVAARLRPLRGTIVLDGADDDVETTAAGLASLLERSPEVTAVVTARRSLGVPGESVHRVGALSPADARALFALRSGHAASPGEAAELSELMAALGHLPLAIELAAARAAQAPFASVIDELSPAAGGDRGPLATALSATLALLAPGQRETLERLCDFRGPFTRESAIAIAGPTAPADLDALLGWSLVAAESRGDLALFRVPEVVHRHVHAPNDDPTNANGPTGSDDSSGARERHTRWFAERTLAAFHELTTNEADAARQRIEAERADIAAAFEHAIDDGDRTSALCIAAGMAWMGLTSGAQASALTDARRAASVPGRAPASVESQARLGHGILAYQLGSMDEAATVLEEALECSREAHDVGLVALSFAFLAYLATLTPDGTRAAVERIRSAQDHLDGAPPSTQAMVALIAAQVYRSRGDHDEALRFTASAHTLAERSGHGWVLLMSGVVAAKVHLDARSPRRALATLRAVLTSPHVLADPIAVLIASSVAAGAAAGTGADAAGARIIGAVDAIGARYGFDPRANEPADFDRYRDRVRQGLTSEQWRDASTRGAAFTLAELVEEAVRLA